MFSKVWEFATSKGVALAFSSIVALLGLYGTFVYQRVPRLTIEVVSNSPVLDVRERVGKLAIIYDGTDLKEANQSLHLLVLRISNQGNADITKAQFDDLAPLGFRVTTGKIVETPTVVGEEYLRTNLKPTIRSDDTVLFSPVILNAGETFEVRLLLLVSGNQTPSVVALGKVAGIHSIPVIEALRPSGQRDYLQEAFGGGSSIQLMRLPAYFLGFIIALMTAVTLALTLFVLPASFITERRQKRARAQNVARFRTAVGRRLSLKEECLMKHYVDNSLVFQVFHKLVRPPIPLESGPPRHPPRVEVMGTDVKTWAYQELESDGLIIRDGPQITISTDIDASAKEFINFVSPSQSGSSPASQAT